MTTADLYTRQQELNLQFIGDLTIVGLGGIGFWVAVDAAMSGVPNLYLFDPDVVEESNRNRLPLCQSSINRPKVEAVADFIYGIRPEATVVPVQDKLEGILLDIQLRVCQHFIDCTDSPKAQHTIYKACKSWGRTYIRAGYDGTRIMVTSNVSGWIKADSEEEAYQINPSWVVPAQVVAALAIGKLFKFTNQEIGTDIGDIGVDVIKRQKRLTARCRQPAGARGR